MATELARRIDELSDWELLAPTPFSTVCFRHHPVQLDDEAELDRINEAILAAVNRQGPVFLSHTRLGVRFTLRVALGNPRQTARHVEQCFRLLQEAARQTA
jgi:aromatic-L-amino-acid decarboxylase